MALTTPPLTAAPRGADAERSGGHRWQPPLALLRWFAWAAVISNGLITVTGATVRVTGSGLGCTTWPDCQPGSLVPVSRSGMAAVHQAIEFGNRTITGIVLVASLGTFILLALVRPVRRQLLWLAAIGPAGVIIQAVLGGVLIFASLRWYLVAPHLLLSLTLVFAAVAVLVRLPESDAPRRLLVAKPLYVVTWLTVLALVGVCVAGTLVTAAGPHAGDATTPRLQLLTLQDWAQLHADFMFLYIGLIFALGIGFLATHAPRTVLIRMAVLFALTLSQGVIGFVQYFLAVPAALVIIHVAGAVALVATAAAVLMATRERPAASSVNAAGAPS